MVRHHVTRFVRVPAAIAGLLALSAAAQATVSYTITNLGTLGGSSSKGQGVNAAGQVTGVADLTGGTASHASLYTPGSGMQDLGTLGGSSSYGEGVNDTGQVVGVASTTGDVANHAFLYTPGTGMQDLGTLAGPGFANATSSALAINAAGQVAGFSQMTGGRSHAFLYTPGSDMQDLGTLGGTSSTGRGVNAAGQVVGDSYTAGNAADHAFLYTPGTGMQDLGTLIAPGIVGAVSAAIAINDAGQVTGTSVTITGAGHAFLYTPGTGMRDIGSLGGTSATGSGINNAGQIVGGSTTAGSSVRHAFLYSGGTMADLNDLLPPLSGWTLNGAYGINDAGQITGFGTYNGQTEAFLLTPLPEPGALAVLAPLPLLGLTRRRRGRFPA